MRLSVLDQELLDRYFRTQVSQDIKRRLSACFVANDNASVPAVRMGRLAVSDSFDCGQPALNEFLRIVQAADIAGIRALLVHAKDQGHQGRDQQVMI